ncbi:MAG: thiamine pyrophosphate-binding protein [Pseudomonadota bacterium]
MSKPTVHQAIAQALLDHGVDTMFGLMGDGNLFMVDHYVQKLGGTFVPVAHEASCVLAATGYAQVSGRVGVATVTHGPALTNCVSALVEAVRSHHAIVLLAGDTPVSRPEHLQNIDQRELIKTTGAGFEQMRAPETAAQDVARAFYRAAVERRPIVLNMPVDFMWEPAGAPAAPRPVFTTPRGVAQSETLDEAIGMIASARRPLILGGGGARHAREAIVKLADRLEAPLACSLRGKGLFHGHPYNIGIFGTLSTAAAYEVMAQADCIVAFGSSLSFYTTDHGQLMAGKRVVHVDVSPEAIGGSRPPDAAIVADAATAAETILYWLDEAEIPGSGFTRDLDPEALRARPTLSNRTPEGYVNYEEALTALNDTLPEDRILCTDVGYAMAEAWARIDVPDTASFIPNIAFTCVGLGLQTAIGAAKAAPDRTVLLMIGDGGFAMGGMGEFHTIVREGLNIVTVIANDSAYGAEHIQFAARQMDPSMSHLAWPDFSGVTRAMGAPTITVNSSETLAEAMSAIDGLKGPLVIELVMKADDMPAARKLGA